MEIIKSIRPSFFRVGISYLLAALLSLLVSALMGFFGGSFLAVLVTTAVLFLYPFFRHIQRNQRVYSVTESSVEIREGILRQTTRIIPLRSIQDVTTTSTFFRRLIGVGDVLIDSAVLPGRILLKNIRKPREFANLILTQLNRWDIESDLISEQRGDPST